MNLCLKDDCDRPPYRGSRGYCGPHYRHRLHTGRHGWRDATPARAHVAELRRLGWTWQAIAETAGLSAYVAHNVGNGRTKHVMAESEQKLLSVPLTRYSSHRGTSAVGSRRRVQALARVGWSVPHLAERVGCSWRSLYTELGRGTMSIRLAHRIADVYEHLQHQRGPSTMAARKALNAGWAPPSAWIRETIDDPDAQPFPWAVSA